MKQYLQALLLVLLGCNVPLLHAERPSLYNVNSSPFAADLAHEVGDLVTIIVNESADAKDNGTIDSQLKDSTFGSMLSEFFKSYLNPTGRLGKIIRGSDNTSPSMKANDFGNRFEKNIVKGEAKNTNNHTFTTILQARVVEVVAPGQLLIRGSRSININGKMKEIFVSGVVRQRDIGKDDDKKINNSIRSELLADAEIEIDGEVVSKDLQPGFLGKLLRKIF